MALTGHRVIAARLATLRASRFLCWQWEWEYLAAETIFEHAKCADKTMVFVEGATHLYDTCTSCEKYPGQFGNTQKTTYDYVDSWLSKTGRFLAGSNR